MNRIFRTLWNAVRRAVVVVDENAGTAQSRRVVSESDSPSVKRPRYVLVPSAVSLALAGVFFLWGGDVEAAKTFPTDCASVGGTMVDGVCHYSISGRISYWDDWMLQEGNLVIQGGEEKNSYGRYYNSRKISKIGEGTLSILGGVGDRSSGILLNGYDYFWFHDDVGEILNEGIGNIVISGGNGEESFGIEINSTGQGLETHVGPGIISNKGAGSLIISGGSGLGSFGIYYGTEPNLDGGAQSTISNLGEGTLIIRGGDGAHSGGIYVNALSNSSSITSNVGNIINQGSGLLRISGGSNSDSHGIEYNAKDGGIGKIRNIGSGTMEILGGSSKYANGISWNAYGDGSEGSIVNEADGKLIIRGGKMESSGTGTLGQPWGIEVNAYDGGRGEIINSGTGEIIIGGVNESVSMEANAGERGVGSILNTGEGTIKISDNGLFTNATNAGTAFISNTGSGGVLIQSGKGASMGSNAYNGEGIISNDGSGTLVIEGGTEFMVVGLVINAYRLNYDGKVTGKILNTGNGTLIIKGGTGESASGISGNAMLAEGLIENSGNGVLTIQGGEGIYSAGIDDVAIGSEDYDGRGEITNGENGTINIVGDKNAGGYGIKELTSGSNSYARVNNARTMNLNAKAIEKFGDGDVLVTNAPTGTVNADAGAIFVKAEGTETGSVGISILQKRVTDWISAGTTVEGFDASSGTQMWALKDDWRLHSKWEDGGSLVITDVMEGSLAAQQIEAAFRETFGTGTSLTFKGENDEASEGLAPKFTTAVANALIAQGYSNSIVTNFNLDATDASGNAQALVIGGTEEGAITDSIGFRQIRGASSVTVKGDKTLALIGNVEGQDLIEGGATVNLDNGGLLLGADAGHEATTGSLTTVSMSNASRVTAENGWFRMDSLSGDGDVTVRENGRLYAADMNVVGDVDNDGTVSADSLTVSGGTFTTSKVLKSEGKISVAESGTLSADGILASDSLDVKGVLKLGQSVSVYTGQQALKVMRERHEDVAADLDRLEGKAGVSTMSVLDRIVAQSMKTETENETNAEQEGGEGTTSKKEDASSASTIPTASHRRAVSVLPQDAQAFAAFDAVKRVASTLEGDVSPDGRGLWVRLLTGESGFGVRSGTKFELDSDGAVIGAEAKLNPEWKVGAALSYLDGEIDAGAGKTNWSSLGMHAYFLHESGNFALKGSAGWLRGTTEAAKDYDADVWHAGVRSEYDFGMGPVTVTPFLGGRVMSGSFDGMSSKTVVSVPLGAKLSGELRTAGWAVRPALEASYVRSMGDTDAEDVRFLPENAFEGSLSVKAEKGAWSGELSYRGAVGSNDYEDRAFEVRIGMKF